MLRTQVLQVRVLSSAPISWGCGVTEAALVLETSGEIRGGAIPSSPTNLWPHRIEVSSSPSQGEDPGALPGAATISTPYRIPTSSSPFQGEEAGVAPARATISVLWLE